MIFVTLGTHELPFIRLLFEVERILKGGLLSERVVAQIGKTPFKSEYFELFNFVQPDVFEEYFKEADIIISHGGVGSLIKGIRMGKKMIAAARLKKFGEHNDDHQKQIIKEFKKLGYICEWEEDIDLSKVILECKSFTPNGFVSYKEELLEFIEQFINKI